MSKISRVDLILQFLLKAGELMPSPIEGPARYLRRVMAIGPGDYSSTLWQMEHRGVIEVVKENNKRFVKLTHKGQLEALLLKACGRRSKKWDKKWRIVLFDIPETSRKQRNLLRSLLKRNDFIRLQDSVFISPYALNRAAIQYLQESGLIDYIRILRIDEMDSDKELKKKFHLK